VEIDLTHEVSERGPSASQDKHRYRIFVVAALTIGLVVGGLAGAAMTRQRSSGGAVVFTGARLVEVNRVVTLRWSLANLSSVDARVDSVLVHGEKAMVGPSDISAKSVTEFTTPLQCGNTAPPQLSIVIDNGEEKKSEIGYLVDRSEWNRLCR
jgi:hypothetical protein